MLLAALLACRDEVDEWRCIGPLVELVTWRDELEHRRAARTWTGTPAELHAEEVGRVAAAVATMEPRRGACQSTWRMSTWTTPDNPGLRVREEAIRQVLGIPPRAYAPEAVGFAGVSVGGLAPSVDAISP
jgi:hypothetical protein